MSENRLDFYENFLLSGVAAVVSKTTVAPIDRVKLVLQTQNERLKQGRVQKPFAGLVDCSVRILKDEGFLQLWRGNLTNVIRYFFTQALNFGFKDSVKAAFAVPKTASQKRKFATNILSGGCAGSLSLIFVYHLDYARTRLASDAGGSGKNGRQFTGIADVYVKTIKSDGIAGLYRGFLVSCMSVFVYRGIYFGLYDSLKPLLLGSNASIFSSFLLAWPITALAGLVMYPVDTVRRRMMVTSGAQVKYKNALDCAYYIIKKEGAGALMRGAGANIMRGIGGAAVLAQFDTFKLLYVEWRDER